MIENERKKKRRLLNKLLILKKIIVRIGCKMALLDVSNTVHSFGIIEGHCEG